MTGNLHHPVCEACGMRWPCKHEMTKRWLARQDERLSRELNPCAHCGKPQNAWGSHVNVMTDGGMAQLYFHDRKGCREAAERTFQEQLARQR